MHSESRLMAEYFGLRAKACELVEAYESAGTAAPARLRRFAGVGVRPPRPKAKKGPRAVVLPALLRWFVARGNRPAVYKEIVLGSGLTLSQVRAAISRNEVQAFERVGGQQVGDKLYASVRLTQRGIELAAEANQEDAGDG